MELYIDLCCRLTFGTTHPGPLVAALANKYTCRVVTVAGSLLTSLAFVLAAFSTNVDMLICTVGLMAGERGTACDILKGYLSVSN